MAYQHFGKVQLQVRFLLRAPKLTNNSIRAIIHKIKEHSMKFKLTEHHYDMKPGSEWFYAGVATPEIKIYGEPHFLVTKIEGDKSEGCLRIIPESKLVKVE